MIHGFMEEVVEFIISFDAEGNILDGKKNYRLHLPPNIPASNYWSIIMYNNLDNLIIRNDQPWPSIHSNHSQLHINGDGSVDAYFGPNVPSVHEKNWIRTMPGENWYLIMRLYDPTKEWFDKLWKPENIELSD
jgi:hypothetical protein